MKPISKTLLLVLTVSFLSSPVLAGTTVLTTDQEKRSYAIGVNVAKNIKEQAVDVDAALVAQGLLDELAGKSVLADAELGIIMQQLQGEVRQKMMAERAEAALANQRRGEAFLAEHGKQAGVRTLPSGVQYQVIETGSGRAPTDADTVQCNYRGRRTDGTTFDASPPGKPAVFKVGQVIPGWQEALRLMPVGSKWQLVIPADRAYGEQGAGNVIGPNETLIFDLELVGIL